MSHLQHMCMYTVWVGDLIPSRRCVFSPHLKLGWLSNAFRVFVFLGPLIVADLTTISLGFSSSDKYRSFFPSSMFEIAAVTRYYGFYAFVHYRPCFSARLNRMQVLSLRHWESCTNLLSWTSRATGCQVGCIANNDAQCNLPPMIVYGLYVLRAAVYWTKQVYWCVTVCPNADRSFFIAENVLCTTVLQSPICSLLCKHLFARFFKILSPRGRAWRAHHRLILIKLCLDFIGILL